MHSFIYICTSPRSISQPPLGQYIPFLILHLFAWRIIYTYNEIETPNLHLQTRFPSWVIGIFSDLYLITLPGYSASPCLNGLKWSSVSVKPNGTTEFSICFCELLSHFLFLSLDWRQWTCVFSLVPGIWSAFISICGRNECTWLSYAYK